MGTDIEPLPADIWFDRIELIAQKGLKDVESTLRHALHLLQLTPPDYRPANYRPIDEDRYEALLAIGDFNAAAQCLVDAPTLTVHTSCSSVGVKVALRCSALNKTIMGTGLSVPEAILEAWAQCLLLLRSTEPKWLRANDI